jgi:hypothetical protein
MRILLHPARVAHLILLVTAALTLPAGCAAGTADSVAV